ncbi:hypothetical protein GOODEAATRI_016792 [Goodea atripinnis]|uniref:Uncharacterized protein n=1 Tax=Goodea atripinnis TaxID=208336 RepID=A0ABV0MSQ1_9TELE
MPVPFAVGHSPKVRGCDEQHEPLDGVTLTRENYNKALEAWGCSSAGITMDSRLANQLAGMESIDADMEDAIWSILNFDLIEPCAVISTKSSVSCKQQSQAVTDELRVNCTYHLLHHLNDTWNLCCNLVVCHFWKMCQRLRQITYNSN